MSEVFSKLGKIQADFNTFRLRDVLTLSDSGVWGDEPEPNTDGTKVIRSTNFTNTGELDLSDVAVRKIAKDKTFEKKLLNGDILVERSGGSDTQPVGRVAFSDFEIEKSDYAFANFIQRIRFNNEVDPRFVFYCLLQMHQMGATESIQNQTTGIRNLDLKSYLRVELPKPEKNEQIRISSLLSQVDNVIQKTKDSIAQAQQLKKTLMQHLLSGRLKPDGTWRTPDEFYVDEKFGRVPKGWTTPRVKEFVDYLKRGRSPEYTESSKYVPVINQKCIEWDRINFDYVKHHDPQVKVPDEFFLLHQDILVNSTGTGTIGRIAMFHSYDYPCYADGHVTIIRTSRKVVEPRFLKYYLMSYNGQRHLESFCYSGSTNQIELSRSYFLNMRVPMPENPDEQTAICDRLDLSQEYIKCSERKINTLQRLKKSLLQNLLTGKIRVQAE